MNLREAIFNTFSSFFSRGLKFSKHIKYGVTLVKLSLFSQIQLSGATLKDALLFGGKKGKALRLKTSQFVKRLSDQRLNFSSLNHEDLTLLKKILVGPNKPSLDQLGEKERSRLECLYRKYNQKTLCTALNLSHIAFIQALSKTHLMFKWRSEGFLPQESGLFFSSNTLKRSASQYAVGDYSGATKSLFGASLKATAAFGSTYLLETFEVANPYARTVIYCGVFAISQLSDDWIVNHIISWLYPPKKNTHPQLAKNNDVALREIELFRNLATFSRETRSHERNNMIQKLADIQAKGDIIQLKSTLDILKTDPENMKQIGKEAKTKGYGILYMNLKKARKAEDKKYQLYRPSM